MDLRAIVFDLDGTLVDSRRDLAAAANELLRRHRGALQSVESLGSFIGHGTGHLVDRALEEGGVSLPSDEALTEFTEIYDRRLLDHTRPYPGIPGVVRTLARSFPLAVLTNKPRDASVKILAGLELAAHFVSILGGDGPYPRKPDPTALLGLADELDTEPGSTLYVGDSIVDFETAERAGTVICLARYGFGFADFPVDRLSGREWLIDAPTDLLDRLARC